MSSGLKRAGSAVLLALSWAAVWMPVGMIVGRIADPDGSLDGVWVPIGAPPGFLCGILFAAGLAVVERDRRLDELSLPRVTLWGAVVGLMVGALPFGISTPAAPYSDAVLGAIVIGPIALMSTLSAVASLLVARIAGRPTFLDAGVDAGGVGSMGGGGKRVGRG